MNKPHSSFNTRSLGISLISTILFFFLLRTFLGHRITLIDRYLSLCTTPFLMVYNSITKPLQEKYHHYKQYQELIKERDFYKEHYVQTHAVLIQNQATYTFDQATEKLHTFSVRYLNHKALLCKVLMHRLSETEQLYTVNAGSRHGVTKNMLALYGSTLLGRVIEVFPYYSYVQLITDTRSRIAVYCSHTKTKGIVEGKNDKVLLSLSYVDNLQPLELGDILISAGEGLLFPEGFGVGKITSFVPQELHYSIEVEPCYDLTTINYCYLIPYENCSYTPVIENN